MNIAKSDHVFDEVKHKQKQRELEVVTKAKKLCEHLFLTTKKAPKEYRWNIIDRLLNQSLSLVEVLYLANSQSGDSRVIKQREADTTLKTLGWLASLGNKMQMFTKKQTEQIGKQVLETRQSLWKWIKVES